MLERFTEKGIKVIMLAQEEARRLGHNFVGTEQILLGLIGEGTGVAAKVLKSLVGKDAQIAEATHSHGLGAARRVYSMPPAHGALLAGRVLSDPTLRASWELELQEICARMIDLRTQLSAKLSEKTNQDFSFISKEKGMFSFLGLSVEQARGLRKERGLYMLDSSRINVAALNQQNMDIVIDAVASVL